MIEDTQEAAQSTADSRDVVTEIKFTLSGNFDEVYDVLERLQTIVSEVNQGDGVEIVVDASTHNSFIEHEGHEYDSEATVRRWEELEQSGVDIDALVHLNQTQKMVEDHPVEEGILKKRIDFFANHLFPKSMEEVVVVIKEEFNSVVDTVYTPNTNIQDVSYPQYLTMGHLDIATTSSENKDELYQKVLDVMRVVFTVKGIPHNFIKNIKINIEKTA